MTADNFYDLAIEKGKGKVTMAASSFAISVVTMGGLGALFAAFLALANKKLRVEDDPMVAKILDALPQTNCGACSVAGCHTFAELLAKGEMPVNGCIAGGQEVADLLAEALGVDSMSTSRIIAVVLCRGGEAETTKNASYRGDMTCVSSVLTGGEKACAYACLGYGDCVDACDFESMAMNSNGLPVVFHDKCVGCGACARVCPRDIIEMHPVERELFVYCLNRDKGAAAKKACKVACIACTLCVKDCVVEGGIVMEENLAVINFETCPQDDTPTKRCPTKCILFGEEKMMTREYFYSVVEPRAVGQ